jgi:predicted RecB family nuclease
LRDKVQLRAEVFEAFLRCPTKAQLYLRGAAGVLPESCAWKRQRGEQFKHAAAECLLRGVPERERYIGMPSAEEWEARRYQVILDCTVTGAEISTRLDALVLDTKRCPGTHPYLPVRFVVHDKITRIDKLLVAFDALALARSSGRMPRAGKIIYGRKGATVTLQLPRLIAEVTRLLPRIGALANSKPEVILNPHCQECEFEGQCRTTALAQDDLSLLARMTATERAKLHEKGIFTVTQLSYTFRPRRRPTARPPKHDHALQALAIRKQQIHTQGTPDLSRSALDIYFDVEGIPERNFYYLIGLRYDNGTASVQESFWADDEAGERAMWTSCLRSLSRLGAC